MNIEYSVHIVWSQEDGAYLAYVFELPGCIADGQTPEEALKNVREVARQWIEVAKEEKREVPQPMSREDFDRGHAAFQKAVQKHIQTEVQNAVQRVLSQIASMHEPSDYSFRRLVVSSSESETAGGSRHR